MLTKFILVRGFFFSQKNEKVICGIKNWGGVIS